MQLQQHFEGADDRERVVVDSDDTACGGVLLYIPEGKTTELRTHAPYTPAMFREHPFARYFFGALGQPRDIRVSPDDAPLIAPTPYVLATQYRTEWERTLTSAGCGDGVIAGEAFNNKLRFQRIVTEVLGPEHSTKPREISAGATLGGVRAVLEGALEEARTAKREKIVVRIPDVRIAFGAGLGVRMIRTADEGLAFLAERGCVDERMLSTDILVEQFITHSSSPSVTTHLDGGVVRPDVNAQLLDGAIFRGSTNILPPDVAAGRSALLEGGLRLAEEAQRRGLRDFVGFDALMRGDQPVVFVESNARETCSTIPRTMIARALRFAEDTKHMDFVFLVDHPLEEGHPHRHDLNRVLNRLQELGCLYDRRDNANLDKPKVILHFAMEQTFDTVFFWDSRAQRTSDPMAEIQAILAGLDLVPSVELPRRKTTT